MRKDEIAKRFQNLHVWSTNGARAPHKPILALWSIGRCLRDEPRLAQYSFVETELRVLLRRFGPPRKAIHPQYPFWRLQREGIWEIDRPKYVGTTSKDDALVGDLKRHNISGGFTATVYKTLQNDPGLALTIAEGLVAGHFPESLRDEVLQATISHAETAELPPLLESVEFVTVRRRRRDASFRARILNAYQFRCAVCAFAGRLDDTPLALEAAHIKWHEANGPSIENNGLALCSLHHRLFDSGAFTLHPDFRIKIARDVAAKGVREALNRYDGQSLQVIPDDQRAHPSKSFLNWHKREVFKGRM